MSLPALPPLPEAHEQFLDSLLKHLRDDERFVGLAAGGSLLSGTVDEYSDLDLISVVADEHYAAVMDQRLQLSAAWGTLLSGFTGEHVGEPRLLICLYDNPLLHIDLKFVVAADLAERIEDPVVLWQRGTVLTDAIEPGDADHPMPDPQWIEDRFWVWIHYAAGKLGRGELFEVVDFLSFVRERVLGPLALVSAGHLPRGVRRLETNVPDFAAELRGTVAAYDATSCGEAIVQCVRLYRELRDRLAPAELVRRHDAERASVAYLHQVMAAK
ncbi:oxalate:formate antiporter [Actinopolymorpha rutila]|uniref:Streptomycin adenylyltransferase n=1 Tax=Actinopolymorpha rutila TaxID=446787 RepID=A0A852ZAB5_9ACTN|nr:oxalate:formate antiporter [Actinopolymorpha rutila]NYH88698.1 hypothetical protein [Actinopolymorpha rutila]